MSHYHPGASDSTLGTFAPNVGYNTLLVYGMVADEKSAGSESGLEAKTFYSCAACCEASFDKDPTSTLTVPRGAGHLFPNCDIRLSA